MEHQYPGPISGDEAMLAELMLPDQVHSRSQDWTIFFLHKDSGADADALSPSRAEFDQGQRAGGDNGEGPTPEELEEEAADLLEGPPLIYVLNHVNTKHDETVRRGGIVKAMAICTRHSFVDIFKPILVLAIEEYFKAPTWDTLDKLYASLNSMDLSLMPRLSLLEKNILQASSAKDIFIEKFERMIAQRKEEDGFVSPQERIRATDYMTSHSQPRFALPRDTHEFESRINFMNHSLPVKIPTAKSVETVGNFSAIKLIQTFSNPHAQSPQPFALHPHLTTGGAYTHPIIVLVNALLTQKRVIFLGHGRPSEEVAEAVLAACSMASGGILRGFTRHAFPYTDLTKVDDLQRVPGFIAGVTNPIFAETPQWWDLLCDLPTGRMKISKDIEQPQPTEGLLQFQQQLQGRQASDKSATNADPTGDAAFMESVTRSITNRVGENVIRSMWRSWIVKLTRIAAAFEESVYGTSALYIGGDQADQSQFGLSGHGYVWADEGARTRELAGNASRIEGWRQTRSYYNFKHDLIQLYRTLPIKTVDLHHHYDRLRLEKLPPNDAAAIYLGLAAAVQSEAEINQLLTTTSEAHGGLFHLSLGLLHSRKDVRHKTTELLERIGNHEAGKHFWTTLNRYATLAFFRIRREMETSTGAWEAQLSRVIAQN